MDKQINAPDMFTEKDIRQFTGKGISVQEIESQIRDFRRGFPFLRLVKPALRNDGILVVGEGELSHYVKKFEELIPGIKVLKFVPASGAATRMFKELFECYHRLATGEEKISSCFEDIEFQPVAKFFEGLSSFAFYADLDRLYRSEGLSIDRAVSDKDLTGILERVLLEGGLNLGNLPKGLILFHDYPEGPRTAVEEHLAEGAGYATNADGTLHLHLTVSPEHLDGFSLRIQETLAQYESKFRIRINVEYSVQKPATDTIAVDMENQPFRLGDDSILFRPGGHGALLENLNDIDADILFLKNIDNVVPDRLKDATILYKKVLAGILVETRDRIFHYLTLLEKGKPLSERQQDEIGEFLEKDLCIAPPFNLNHLNYEEKQTYFLRKLNRPVRVCGMVRNEGEPGGGPFWARNADGTVSLQIAESSQIHMANPRQKEIFGKATHFNPVDLVCSIRDFHGEKFHLSDFRDPETGFISQKSKEGRDLKALELPGLWNGAMSDWNTIFVEVPIITFNPVKTVLDLLRPEHQP